MSNDLVKYKGGVIEMGVDTFSADFTAEIELTADEYNVSTGINRGTGPRFGISAIPGQSTLTYTTTNGRGLRASELTTGSDLDIFRKRFKFLGVVPLSIESYDDFNTVYTILIWIIADCYDGSNYTISATPNAAYTDGGASPNTFKYSPYTARGFYNPMWAQATNDAFSVGYTGFLTPIVRRLAYSNNGGTAEATLKNALNIPSTSAYASIASISVSGGTIPNQWTFGTKIANGDANNTATANMNSATFSGPLYVSLGIPSSWNKGNYKRTRRAITFYNIDALQLIRTYVYNAVDVGTGQFIAALNQDFTTANYTMAGLTATAVANIRGAAFVAANIDNVLMYDPEGFTENSYKIVLVAMQGAFGFFMQCWDRDFTGRAMQIAPLKDRFHKPTTQQTGQGNSVAAGNYTENGTITSTCFSNFPIYVENTASFGLYASASADGYTHFFFGEANSGVLRSNTVYEFTFSIFDKQLGIETNVGAPAKFRTGDTDFVAMTIGVDTYTAGVVQQETMAYHDSRAPIESSYFSRSDGTSTTYNAMANMLEFRFYYRAMGTFEWLPARFIDAAEYYFNPDYRVFWACEGNVAGLPGGQPGGFIDNSFLPDDKYDCVVNFKNRAFWFSRTSAIFSLQNNPFAYPLRNGTPAPTGGFRGGIVHTYRGQSEQESRLVIFGQKDTYIGKFTGVYLQQPVQVSADTTASYDVDGSDFVVEAWTSITAFSHRSAVVADGILYWWGPQGIYRDDGVGVPTKISKKIEPNVFSLFAPDKTDEIHCYYDEKTKDIIWFYPPKGADTLTYALAYDVEVGEFLFERFDCKIDWATRVNTMNAGITQGLPGLHTFIASRKTSAETLQRGYFFDQENRAGDYRPETELMVHTLTASVTTNQYDLTFDSGVDATNFATMAVGDFISMTQIAGYYLPTHAAYDSFIGKITVIDTGAKTMRILLPAGVDIPSIAISDAVNYVPAYHRAAAGRGLNGIPFVWETEYWMPSRPDVSNYWLFIYMFFKYTTWKKTQAQELTFSNRTPSGGPYVSDTIEMVDNSDGNWQCYHALRQDAEYGGQNQGQAIKLKISGYHIGEEWQLQYLEAHCSIEEGNILKQYQG